MASCALQEVGPHRLEALTTVRCLRRAVVMSALGRRRLVLEVASSALPEVGPHRLEALDRAGGAGEGGKELEPTSERPARAVGGVNLGADPAEEENLTVPKGQGRQTPRDPVQPRP